MAESRYVVGDADRHAFARDGAICLRGVLGRQDCDEMLEASLAFMAAGEGRINEATRNPSEPRFFSATYMSQSNPAFRRFCLGSPLPGVAAQVMGTGSVRFFYDQLFIKEGGAAAPTPWHNDLPFWPLLGSDIVSLWVALTPVSTATSGLEYLAGSHHAGTMYQARGVTGSDRLKNPSMPPCPDYNDPANRGDGTFLSWDLQPGDVLCHHPLTLHGAGANTSPSALRVGLSVRYMGQDVRWDPRSHVMKLPRDPAVPPGAFPADDAAFPPAAAT